MEPDWDRLKKEYADTPNVVIGACDCTTNCKGKCGEHQVQGFPTLKLQIDGRIEEFNGGRDFNSMKREIEKKLNPRPACSLDSKDACKPEDLKILEESEKMTKAERAAKIKEEGSFWCASWHHSASHSILDLALQRRGPSSSNSKGSTGHQGRSMGWQGCSPSSGRGTLNMSVTAQPQWSPRQTVFPCKIFGDADEAAFRLLGIHCNS